MKIWIGILVLALYTACSSEKKPVVFKPVTPSVTAKFVGSWSAFTASCDNVVNGSQIDLAITEGSISYAVDLGGGCAPDIVLHYSGAYAADNQGYVLTVSQKQLTCDEVACGGTCPTLPMPDRMRWSFTNSSSTTAMAVSEYDDPASPVHSCVNSLTKDNSL